MKKKSAKHSKKSAVEKKSPIKKATKRKSVSQRGKQIHVLTDGTGGLPRHFLTAVLSQFPTIKVSPKYHVFCTSAERTRQAYAKHIGRNAILFHSFAESENKFALEAMAAEDKIPCFDLTGSAVSFLAQHIGAAAAQDVSLVHSHDSQYFDRIDAWEFTMQHDDSRRLESIDQADLILLGVSRVSKTPTSAYLGWLGYRVANVSFAPECGLPKEVKKHRKKVIALTIKPKQLSEIRSRRMQVNGFADVIAHDPKGEIKYAGLEHTIREVMESERMYRDLRVPIVDVTDSTVEETAARVLQIIGT